MAQTKIVINDYTLHLVPVIIAAVVNFAVFIVIRRSQALQNSKTLRYDLFLNLALGNLVMFLVDGKAVFFPEVLLQEVTCRFTVYIAEVSLSVIQASLIIAALCRYLNVTNPYNFTSVMLQKASSALIWMTAAVLCVPYLVLHGIVTVDHISMCDFLPEEWAGVFYIVNTALFFVPTVIYGVLIHLVLRAVGEEHEANGEVGALCFGSRIVRLNLVLALTILTPLQIIYTLNYGVSRSLHALATISSVMLYLASNLEPLCFAILNPEFRREYRMQTSQQESYIRGELNVDFSPAMPLPI